MSWRQRSYEHLPVLSVRGRQLRRAMRLVTVAYVFAVAWVAGISGSQVKIFSRMLGFNDFAFGVMAALPFVATFAQLAASIMIERTGLLKYQFMYCATIHRAVWLVVAAIPLVLPVPSAWAVTSMMGVLTLSWLMNALAAPAWLTWMGRLIPRRIRGRYFATRERWAILAQILCVLVIGIALDVVYDAGKGDSAAAQPAVLWTISAIFVVAGVCGVIDILLFRKVPEVVGSAPESSGARLPAQASRAPAGPAADRGRGERWWRRVAASPAATVFRELIVQPMADRVFRHYVLFGATMMFSITVGSWYFWLHAMENLGFSPLATQTLFLAIGPLAGIVSAKGWGAAIDRWGRRPVLLIASVTLVVTLLPWLFISPQTPAPQFVADAVNGVGGWVAGLFGREGVVPAPPGTPLGAYLVAALATIVGGAAATGMNLAQVGIVLGFSDGSGQSRYVAASSVLISVGGMLGGLAGGVITQLLKGLHLVAGPFTWNNWHAAFVVAIAVRTVSVFWLIGMPDHGAVRVRFLVRMMGANIFNSVSSRVFYPLRIFGWRRPEPPVETPEPDRREEKDR